MSGIVYGRTFRRHRRSAHSRGEPDVVLPLLAASRSVGTLTDGLIDPGGGDDRWPSGSTKERTAAVRRSATHTAAFMAAGLILLASCSSSGSSATSTTAAVST